jgi:hypothetical protein
LKLQGPWLPDKGTNIPKPLAAKGAELGIAIVRNKKRVTQFRTPSSLVFVIASDHFDNSNHRYDNDINNKHRLVLNPLFYWHFLDV